jgi:hypothetical protein
VPFLEEIGDDLFGFPDDLEIVYSKMHVLLELLSV